MNRSLAAVLLALLVIPMAPSGQALHLHAFTEFVDDPDRPLWIGLQENQTRVRPVDTGIEQAYDMVNGTNGVAWAAAVGAGQSAYGDAGVLRVFHDEMGNDGRQGGIGGWQVLGDAAWRLDRGYQADGWAYVMGGASYATPSKSMLVTPAIDLETGFIDEPARQATPVTDVAGPQARSTWNSAPGSSDAADPAIDLLENLGLASAWAFAKNAYLTAHQRLLEQNIFVGFFLDDREGPITLEFRTRYNLGEDRDGLQVRVYTEEPKDTTCPASTCTVLQTGPGASAMEGSAITGYSLFTQRFYFDITQYAEQTVWVGFYHAAMPLLSARYFDSGFFNTTEPLRGALIDEVTVKAPAHPASLHVRPLTEPSLVPAGRVVPTVANGTPFHVEADIVNDGLQSLDIEGIVTVTDRTTGSIVSTDSVSATVPRAGYLRVSLPMELGPGKYEATVTGHSGVIQDAESILFDVADVAAVKVSKLSRSSPTVATDDVLTLSADVRNAGNIPYADNITIVTHVDGQIIDLVTDPLRAVALAPGENTTLEWTVDTANPGRYSWAIVSGSATLDPEVALAQHLGPDIHASTWLDQGLVIDGSITDAAWNQAPTFTFQLDGQGPTYIPFDNDRTLPRPATARFLNDDSNLYIALELADSTRTTREDLFNLFFDDGGDGALSGDADGVRWDLSTVADLSLDDLNWTTGAYDGDLAVTDNGTHYIVEIRHPLGVAGTEGLQAGPGDLIAWMLHEHDGHRRDYHAPIAAAYQDGRGLLLPDGSLIDESLEWLPLRLATATSGFASPQVFPGPGFGVGQAPPAIFEVPLDECPTGWGQEGIRSATLAGNVVSAEKWTCAPHPLADGLALWEGVAHEDDPYSRLGSQIQQPGPGAEMVDRRTGDIPPGTNGVLVSPPFTVDGAEDPTLHLYHQYATRAYIVDENTRTPTGIIVPGERIVIRSIGRITLQTLEDGGWSDPILLVPEGGYTTEADVGIEDPRIPGGRSLLDAHAPCAPGAPHQTPPDRCGFWWPVGEQDAYRALEDDIAKGGEFEGSPWLVDRIPLTGAHGRHGEDVVDLEGKTLRLRFWFMRGGPGEGDEPFGWRLGPMAVSDGARFQHDLAVLDVQPATSYDAAGGLGPGTKVMFNVTVANNGAAVAPVATVRLTGDCDAVGSLASPLGPGEKAALALPCAVGTDPLNVGASVLYAPEEFPADNKVPAREWPVIARPDVAVAVSASPSVAGPGFERDIFIRLTNEGNVPVQDFDVDLSVVGTDDGVDLLNSQTWHIDGTLGVGETRSISDPSLGATPTPRLTFTPALVGRYEARVVADLEDVDPSDNANFAVMSARSVLYDDNLAGRPVTVAGVVNGKLDLQEPFRRADLGPLDSRAAITAADTDGRIPADTDASIHLPDLDLTTLRQASLAVRHRYDLEEAYDGARLEINDGTGWLPLTPRPNEAAGLPNGHPDIALAGDNALGVRVAGQAFTGSSADITDDGWLVSEYDLADDPRLRKTTVADSFTLDDLASEPAAIPGVDFTGASRFTHPTWALGDQQAVNDGRLWWLDNRTGEGPRSGRSMWYSGSIGTGGATAVLDTTLELKVDIPANATLTFWERRAGWQDGPHGTGAHYLVDAGPGCGQALIVKQGADGWNQRAMDLSKCTDDPAVKFRYFSSPGETPAHGAQDVSGWSIDDLAITSASGTFALDLESPDHAALFVSRDDAALGATGWRLSDSELERPSAWHIDDVDGRRAWRFADDSEQGYPHLADAALISPVIDLTDVVSGKATLHFSHRHDFEAVHRAGRDDRLDDDYTAAIDGGQILVQVEDPALSAFGPWQPLLKSDVDRIFLRTCDSYPVQHTPCENTNKPELGLATTGLGFQALSLTGYTALYERGVDDSGARYGNGASFQSVPGFAKWDKLGTWTEFPAAPVFSGDVPWRDEAWAIDQLAGKRFRLAFHASTNGNLQATGGGHHGWSIADVAVTSDVFDGAPVQARLRLGTDGSVTGGDWTISDITLVGERFERNIGILPGNDSVAPPAASVVVPFTVQNLGTADRARVAVEISTVPARPFEVNGLPADEDRFGPFTLGSSGGLQDRIPFTVTLDAPAEGRTTEIHVRLLEDQGSSSIIDGTLVHVPRWATPVDENTGNLAATVQVTGSTVDRLAWQETPTLAFVDGDAANATAVLRNEGTRNATPTFTWTLEHVVRKGGQVGTTEIVEPVHTASQSAHTLQPGAQAAYTYDLHRAADAGLYRLTATAPGLRHVTEFMVDGALEIYAADFTEDLHNWTTTATPSTSNDFRHRDNLRWGVDEDEFLSGRHYCSQGGCDAQGTSPLGDVGPEAAAISPSIDLSALPDGRATLSVTHTPTFRDGDGATVEILPLRYPVDPILGSRPAFTCQDGDKKGSPTWFRLSPVGGSDGMTSPPVRNTVNPLGPEQPVLQGPSPARTDRFDLRQVAIPVCPLDETVTAEPTVMTNYTVQVRLHVGLQPGAGRMGSQGWSIDHVGISAAGVSLDPPAFEAPIVDGATKRFPLTLTNTGPGVDTFGLAVDPLGSTLDSDWVQFQPPTATLGPGESRTILASVHLPAAEGLNRGQYLATFEARSRADATLTASSRATLGLVENPLPDLSISIDPETPIQQGTVVPIHITAFNGGDQAAQEAPVEVVAIAPDGTRSPIGTAHVPSLCAVTECGAASRRITSVEWAVPEVPGRYTIEATIDPLERIIEQREDNNNVSLAVQVAPLERPDLSVAYIHVDGLVRPGVADQGGVLVATAGITNTGHAPAFDTRVVLLAGSVALSEQTIDVLLPGQTRNISAVKVAHDDLLLRAFVIPQGSELDDSNNERSAFIRVQEHDLTIQAPATTVAPGGRVKMEVNVTNLAGNMDRVRITGAGDWTLTSIPELLVLPPNASMPALLFLQAPADARSGEHTVDVLVTPDGGIPIAQQINVTVQAIEQPPVLEVPLAGVTPGATKVPIMASSASNVPQSFVVTVGGPTGWVGSTEVTLAPGETKRVLVPLQTPSDAAPGRYDLTATAAVAEDQEPLAVSYGQVDMLRVSQASADWIDARRTVTTQGDQIVMRLAISNDGNAPWRPRLITVDAPPGVILPVVEGDVLAPGEESVMEAIAHLGAEAPARPWARMELRMAATDGVRVIPLEMPDPTDVPDLTLSGLTVTPRGEIKPGDRVTVTAKIHNAGFTASQATKALAYADGVLVGAVDVPAIAAGEVHEATFPFKARGGQTILVVEVDGTRHVLESVETNNAVSQVLDVGETPFQSIPAAWPAMLLLALVVLTGWRRRR